MKLKTVVEITPALQALAATKLPAKIAYRVAKALNVIKPDIAAYEEQRIKLAGELGTLDGEKQLYTFTAENAATFDTQIKALLDEDVQIALPTITPDDLGDATIEGAHLAALDGIFIIEPETPK